MAKFTSHAGAHLEALRRAVETACEVIGGAAESYASALCPVKTGNLRNSISHEVRDGHTMVVGSRVSYAPYVELGHHQQPGRYVPAIGKRLKRDFVPGKPFLAPAVEGHIPEYQSICEQIIGAIGK